MHSIWGGGGAHQVILSLYGTSNFQIETKAKQHYLVYLYQSYLANSWFTDDRSELRIILSMRS